MTTAIAVAVIVVVCYIAYRALRGKPAKTTVGGTGAGTGAGGSTPNDSNNPQIKD